MKRACCFGILGVWCLVVASARGQTQLEMNEESYKAFRKADVALNVAYKRLLGELDAEGKKNLQEAQRAWIKFRDAECESAADDYRGGSIRPLIYNTCAEALTVERTKHFTVRLADIAGH